MSVKMRGNLIHLLFVAGVFLGPKGTDAVIVDPPADDNKQCCDTSADILKLVEQMNTKMASLDDNMDTRFAALETRMDEKIELYVTRLENKLMDEFKTLNSRLTSSEANIIGLQGQVITTDTNNELHITRLENKLSDKLDQMKNSISDDTEDKINVFKTENMLTLTGLENKLWSKLEETKNAIVDNILSGSKYELTINNDRIIDGVSSELTDIRQVLLTDRQKSVESFENISRHVEETIEQASPSLAYSGLNNTPNVNQSINEIVQSIVVENQKSLDSFKDDLSKTVERSIEQASLSLFHSSLNLTSALNHSLSEIMESFAEENQNYLSNFQNLTHRLTNTLGESTAKISDIANFVNVIIDGGSLHMNDLTINIHSDLNTTSSFISTADQIKNLFAGGNQKSASNFQTFPPNLLDIISKPTTKIADKGNSITISNDGGSIRMDKSTFAFLN